MVLSIEERGFHVMPSTGMTPGLDSLFTKMAFPYPYAAKCEAVTGKVCSYGGRKGTVAYSVYIRVKLSGPDTLRHSQPSFHETPHVADEQSSSVTTTGPSLIKYCMYMPGAVA